MRRVHRRFVDEGDVGVVHRLRGRPSNAASDPGVRKQAVGLYREHYADFGCTLACEMLAERHGLVVDDQTLRRWLTEAKLYRRRRRSPVKRRRRVRKECFGQLVQIDGSHHDWFERRNPEVNHCVLMVMIDDATGFTLARFFLAETTRAAMTIFREWTQAHGLPQELYPDRHSIYRVNTKAADEQQARSGKRPLTQFGRAMAELDVKMTCAKSPQAKGRVERMNGTLQDRLVKALRVEGISDIESANRYLAETFLAKLNARFTVQAAQPEDVHLPVSETELAGALCVKDQRTVGRDHCVVLGGRVLQLKPKRSMPSLAGKRVTVQRDLQGVVRVLRGETVIEHEALARRAQRQAVKPGLIERVSQHTGPHKPAKNHPWQAPIVPPANRRPRAEPSPVEAGSAAGSAPPRPPLRQPQPAA